MKRLTGIISAGILLAAMASAVFVFRGGRPADSKPTQTKIGQQVYVTWDIMEFDKCVSAWLISRFIDKNAKFVFYPEGTEIKEGIVFDVPGADWSRKHRKCTSDCVLESLGIDDPAVKKIVEMAHQTELNFWQLESFPEAKEHFYNVKAIMEQYPKSVKCFESTNIYFDNLYESLKKENLK